MSWHWHFSNGWFWVGVILFALLVAGSLNNLHRRGWPAGPGMLEALRLLLAALVLLALAKPETWQRLTPEEPTTFLVLTDRSQSMETRDMTLTDGNSGSRLEWLEQQTAWKSALGPQVRLQFQDFESSESGQTDLHSALLDAAQASSRSLGGLLLFSDGDWNTGAIPEQAALALRRMGLPVFALPVGQETALPDVAIRWLPMPSTLIVDEPARLPFELENRFARPMDLTVTFQVQGSTAPVEERRFRLEPGEKRQDSLDWRPDQEGDLSLQLSTPALPRENRQDNNSATVSVNVRKDQLQVLLVDSAPRWEFRYLRNALMRDPGVELSCVLYHPHPELGMGQGPSYLDAFPSTLEALSPFDVVFLGDIGVSQDELTETQAEWLRGLVERQASGLVFLPGRRGLQRTLQDSALADLIPVALDPSSPATGIESATPSAMELTAMGRENLLVSLGDSQEETAAIWRSLPGFYWHAPVARAKAGSTTLAVHESSRNAYGRLPLLVTRPFGSGKVLYLATDGAWRWRRGVEDRYHYRFWSQVARWMAYQRNLSKSRRGRLIHYPESPEAGREVTFDATLLDRQLGPLKGATPTLTWQPLDAAANPTAGTLPLEETPGDWGVYRGQWTPPEGGRYQLIAEWKDDPTLRVESTVVVSAAIEEATGDPARPDVMRRVAEASGGSFLPAGNMDALAGLLTRSMENQTLTHRIQWWHHPGLLTFLLVGLTVYWMLRKRLGLV